MNKAHDTGDGGEGFNAEEPTVIPIAQPEVLRHLIAPIDPRRLAVTIAALRIRRALNEAHAALPDEDAEALEAEIWGLATEEDEG